MTETALALARKAGAHFRDRGFDNAQLEAERLLAAVLGMRRLDLYLQHDRPVSPEELDAFRAVVRRRLRREPLQYILGETGFRRLVLRVDRRVLIPRPETEILVGEVLAWAGQRTGVALDLGTGSGAIALSLAAEGGFERVVATDVSAGALVVAAANAAACGMAEKVDLRQGAFYDAVAGMRFDAIASNPPYVAETDRALLPPEVAEWEPCEALFAGRDGMDALALIIAGAPAHLRPGGLLALEVGVGQAAHVAERIHATGAFCPPRIVRDLAGQERVVLAESKRETNQERT